MTYRFPPFHFLRTFEAAARHLSFKQAARELHVTPAAVSQQIRALEAYLGFPLFRRLTRAVELTERGAAMLPKLREGFDCLVAAVESARQGEPAILAVTAAPSFASHWLVPRLPRFHAEHPEVDVALASSSDAVGARTVSRVLDEPLVDLRDDRTGVAILYGRGSYPGFRATRLFTPDYVPVCVPGLATPERPLRTPDDLRLHPLIHDETVPEGEHRPCWSAWLALAGAPEVDARRGPRFANAVLAHQAALNGQGVALAPRPFIEADVAAGRLVIPFDVRLPSPYAYSFVVPEALAGRAAVVAFRDWLVREAGDDVPASRAAQDSALRQ